LDKKVKCGKPLCVDGKKEELLPPRHILMSIIMEKNKEEVIATLKKLKDHVFKIVKETIYAIPEEMVCHYKDYNDFLKFAKEHPEKVFDKYYFILEEIKEIEEL